MERTEEILIRFTLLGDQARALRQLSMREYRQPRDQVRAIVRQALEQSGCLQPENKSRQEASSHASSD